MFKEELGKTISNKSFYFAIVSMALLLMTGCIYVSYSTGREYTFFDILFAENKDDLIQESGYSAVELLAASDNTYAFMFLPIVSAVPFVMTLCGEKKNSLTRYEIFRTGKNRYLTGKFLATIVTGGLVATGGTLIYALCINFMFPHGMGDRFIEISKTIRDESRIFDAVVQWFGITGVYLIKMLRMFMYGAFSTIPAFAFSALVRNRYVVLSLPFILNYFFTKLVSERDWYRMRPENIGNIFFVDYSWMALWFGGIVVFVLIWYRVCLERKCDCGED